MAASTQRPDLAAVRQRQQRTWAAGDFAVIGLPTVIVGEQLCEAVDLRAGQRVLDVATGSGNTALAAARRSCEVTGIDWVPELLARARERAAAERLPIEFSHGEAEGIPFPDGAFDAVLSTFGAMFAADQERTAGELLRVCRPGGRIGLACWTPDGLVGELLRTTAGHAPPAAGLEPATRWGTEERLRQLLGPGVTSLWVTRRSLVYRFRSPRDWLDLYRAYYGPTIKAFEALAPDGQEALARDLLDLLHRFNRADDGTVVAPSDYLEVVAIRR